MKPGHTQGRRISRHQAPDLAPTYLRYGTATAANEVDGIPMPAVVGCRTGDYVAYLASGGDRLIVGPISTRVIYGGVLPVTTDASGDFTVTPAALGMSTIESLVGNLNGVGAVVLSSVRASGSDFILRFRNLSDGSVFASSSTNVRIIAVGTPA